jgi:phosphoserine phosphatase
MPMSTLILHSPQLTDAQRACLAQRFPAPVEMRPDHCRLALAAMPTRSTLDAVREQLGIDVNVLPAGFDPAQIRLVISDMDSTLINIECVDEIADFAGVKEQVAAITAAAMRGEMNFPASLRKRVALLKGVPSSALQTVYQERLRLNPGADILLAGLKARQIKFALVSGGFTFFTSRLQARLGIDFTLANTLDIAADGRLSGTVEGAIVGAEAKRDFLARLCEQLAITPAQCIAVGDGANDLLMMAHAGLGVAYHAKPKVQAEADIVINHGGLDALLALLTHAD